LVCGLDGTQVKAGGSELVAVVTEKQTDETVVGAWFVADAVITMLTVMLLLLLVTMMAGGCLPRCHHLYHQHYH
jgi:uncharacterized membrane protein